MTAADSVHRDAGASDAAAAGAPPVLDRPLGAFESAMALTQEHAPFNAVVVVALENAPTLPTLRAALDALQRRHPALRCAVTGRGGRRRFVPSVAPLPLTAEPRTSADTWQQAVEEELARRLPLELGPLAHARYLRDEAGRAELLLTLAHIVVDAASGAHLVDELLSLCGGLALDAAPLPPLPFLESRFPARFRGVRGRLRAYGALARTLLSEIGFHLRTRRARLPGVDATARARIVTWRLAGDSTHALVRRCRRGRLPLNSVLIAAFVLAVRHVRRAGRALPARIYTMADLRAYLSPPVDRRPLGAGWAMLRFLIEPGADDLWSTAHAVNEQVSARLAVGEKFLSYLAIRPMMRLALSGPRLRMGEVAVSYTGAPGIAERYGGISVLGLDAFVSNFDLGPECLVQARLWRGELSLGVVYLDTDMNEAEARALVADAAATLVSGNDGGARP